MGRKMISVLHGIFALRSAIPLVFTLSVAPPYFCVWAIMRAVSALLPNRSMIYRHVDDMMYDVYQTVVVFFLETYAGTEVLLCFLIFAPSV